MSKQKLDVVCAVCPYCDGENAISRVQAGHGELDSTDHEIARKYCRSLFTLAESMSRIRSLFKQEPGAAQRNTEHRPVSA